MNDAPRPYPVMLSIAGSDSGGGAGIQADIKIGCQLGVFVATAITSVTSQNTCEVVGRSDIAPDFISSQILTVCADTMPQAAKTGMIPTPEAVVAVARTLRSVGIENLVVDPVLISTSGHALASPLEEVAAAMREELFPLATLVTPNLHEAAYLAGFADTDSIEPPTLCSRLGAKAVLLKGGHKTGCRCDDLLIEADSVAASFPAERIDTVNTHGTGCSLSSAIACSLAAGMPLMRAIANAKDLITTDLRLAADYRHGKGHGPLFFFTGGKHYINKES